MGDVKTEQERQMCEPCLRDGVDEAATFYCKDCSEKMCTSCQRYHRKIKFTSEHVLQSLQSIKGSVGNDIAAQEFLKNLKKCSKHPYKPLKFSCQDHDELCCSTCATLLHRKCDHIMDITDKVKSCANDTRAALDKLTDVEDQADKLLEIDKKQLRVLEDVMDKTKINLFEMKQKILEMFEETSKQAIQMIQSEQKDISTHVLDNISATERFKLKIKECREKIDHVMKHGDEAHVYLYTLRLEKEQKQFLQGLMRLHESQKSDGIVVDMKQDFTEMLKWVRVRKTNSEPLSSPPPIHRLGRDRGASLKRYISTSFSGIRGFAWLNNDCLFACDDDSAKVDLYDVNKWTCMRSFRCPSQPGTMTQLDGALFAVSYPKSSSVIIRDERQASSSIVREIKTQSVPQGLAYNSVDKQLLVQSRDGKIVCVRLDGTLAGELPLADTVVAAVQSTYQIAFSSILKVCYLACYDIHKVIAMDLHGQVVFDYSHKSLKLPYGICLGPDGDIYVSSYSGNCIHQIDQSGYILRELLTEKDGLNYPRTISFNDRMDQFAVTCNGNSALRVYDFI